MSKALSDKTMKDLFGDFTYTEDPRKKGLIIPDPVWVAEHIVSVSVPYADNDNPKIFKMKCHKAVQDSIINAFDELERRGWLNLVRTVDGCFVPRHRLWNPKNGRSRHSWGIALDLNVPTCPYGKDVMQPPGVLLVFARHGFLFGHLGSGLWSDKATPDAMHGEWVLPYLPK